MGARPQPLFLAAAGDQAVQLQALFNIDHPDPLGPVGFMGGCGQVVEPHRLHVDGNVRYSLHGVRVEDNPLLSAKSANLGDGLKRSYFVVRKHY